MIRDDADQTPRSGGGSSFPGLVLRDERPGDADAIRALVAAAFAPMDYSDGSEPEIVDRLRADGELLVSCVAGRDGQILGHVAASPARLGGQAGWVGIGPVAVHPDHQRQGIGGAMMRHVLDRLRAAPAARGVVLIGDPNYYGRFGFVAECGVTWRDIPTEYVQRLTLSGPEAAGEITYARAFD